MFQLVFNLQISKLPISVARAGRRAAGVAAKLRLAGEAVGARVAAQVADGGGGRERRHVGELDAFALWRRLIAEVGGRGRGQVVAV